MSQSVPTSTEPVDVRRRQGVYLLRADPDLGRRLTPREFDAARLRSVVATRSLSKGAWHPEQETFDEDGLGLLIIDGIVRRRTVVAGQASAEVLGTGDLLRPWQSIDEYATVASHCEWKICAATTIAVLDAPLTQRLAAWPSVLSQIAGRAVQRSGDLALSMAISALAGAELRIQLMLWHLADRWGRVHPRGATLPLKLEQSTIGELVGLSRSRVSDALGELERMHRLERSPEGWLLCGPRPEQLLRGRLPEVQADALVGA